MKNRTNIGASARRFVVCSFAVLGSHAACALPLTPGNILAAELHDRTITEYTPSGGFVQQFTLPENMNGSFPFLRDIAVDQDGNIHAFNGSSSPLLSVLNPATGTLNESAFPAWFTQNNGGFGGIAVHGQYTYVTDMGLPGGGEQGIIRFDSQGGPAIRFGEDPYPWSFGYKDLTLGGNGLLYALEGNETIDVFDPATLTRINSFSLAGLSDVRGIAVDSDGQIYAASWDGSVTSHTTSGGLIDTLATGTFNLYDINLNDDDQLLISNRFGHMILADTSLTGFTSFVIPHNGLHEMSLYSAFVTPLTIESTGLTGDLNGDGYVGVEDLDIILAHWGDTVTASDLASGDASGDGNVGQADLQIVLDSFGNGTPPESTVPEPHGLTLLGIGGLALVRRRR